jgi:hypothetical protein
MGKFLVVYPQEKCSLERFGAKLNMGSLGGVYYEETWIFRKIRERNVRFVYSCPTPSFVYRMATSGLIMEVV